MQYTRNDLFLITRFLNALKDLNGEWSRHGLQRMVRFNSECSQSYVSLRNFRIKADVPVDEVFKDPYALIETLIFRKFTILKSKQLNKYVCFHRSGIFVLKNLNELDKFCVFNHRIRMGNSHQFSLGSNNNVYLSFNKFGRLINPLINKNINQNECKNNKSNIFYIHTKLTDAFPENSYFPTLPKSFVFFSSTLRPVETTKITTPITTKYFRRRLYKRPFRKYKTRFQRYRKRKTNRTN